MVYTGSFRKDLPKTQKKPSMDSKKLKKYKVVVQGPYKVRKGQCRDLHQ